MKTKASIDYTKPDPSRMSVNRVCLWETYIYILAGVFIVITYVMLSQVLPVDFKILLFLLLCLTGTFGAVMHRTYLTHTGILRADIGGIDECPV